MNNNYQIVILDEQCIASNYGVSTYIAQLLDIFKDFSKIKLYHVVLLCSNKEVALEKISDNITMIKIPQYFGANIKDSNQYFNKLLYIIRRYVDENHHTIFHFNFIISEYFVSKIKKVYLYNRSYYTAHTTSVPFTFDFSSKVGKSNQINHEEIIKQNIIDEGLFLSKMDIIYCLSDATKDVFLDKYKIERRKLVRINNGLKDNYKKITEGERIKLREEYNFNDYQNTTLILYVGRLDYYKGLSYLIKAVENLLKENKGFYLIIVGDGYYDSFMKLRNKSWRNILFTGKLPKDKVYELYQVCDIGVLPSLSEQCSFVAIEMMMFGLPIIASNANGLSEMFIDHYNAIIIDLQKENQNVFSIEELADKIKYLSNNKKLMDKIRKNARFTYEDKYIFAKFKKKLLSRYQI